jgi:hypothetical protein
MNRARFTVAATLLSTAMAAGAVLAQVAPPDMKPILAGRKITPPLKGEATIEFVQPVTKRNGDKVVTTIKVRNAATGPVARLQVTETWYDKGGAIVAGGKGVLPNFLNPGEVGTITIETPFNAKMSSNGWNFTHANGTVKTAKVKSLDAPADKAPEKK